MFPAAIKGRGAVSNPEGRFEGRPKFWLMMAGAGLGEPLPSLETSLMVDAAKTIITRNDSPDIPFEQSITRIAAASMAVCTAARGHAYANLYPRLDFETKLFYKPNAGQLLEMKLHKPGYRCSMRFH